VSGLKTPAKGVDVSTWQHPNNHPIDWHEVASAGYTFAIVKASQGSTWVNPWLERDLDDARAAGLLVGAYHFYEMGVNPESQVDHAISVLMGQVLELGFYLDWEPGEVQPWQLPETYNAFLAKAMQTRNPTGTYCAQSWSEVLHAANAPIYRLWLADLNPEPTGKPFLWQNSWTDKVPGIGAAVDEDILLSTRGLNIPTGPPVKPNAATVHSVKDTVEKETTPDAEDEWDLLAEHTPPQDAMRSTPADEPASE
jgi:lysozyme